MISTVKREIAISKELHSNNMGSEELAANLFRITQTESRLKKDNIQGEKQANKTHYKIGKALLKMVELCQKICQHLKKVWNNLKKKITNYWKRRKYSL